MEIRLILLDEKLAIGLTDRIIYYVPPRAVNPHPIIIRMSEHLNGNSVSLYSSRRLSDIKSSTTITDRI